MRNAELLQPQINLLAIDCVESFAAGGQGDNQKKIFQHGGVPSRLDSLRPMGKDAYEFLVAHTSGEELDKGTNSFIYKMLAFSHKYILVPSAYFLAYGIAEEQTELVDDDTGEKMDVEAFREYWWGHDYVGQAHFFTQPSLRDWAFSGETALLLAFSAAVLWGIDSAVIQDELGDPNHEMILEMSDLSRFVRGEHQELRSHSARKAALAKHSRTTAPQKKKAHELYLHYSRLPHFDGVSRSEIARKISQDSSITATLRTITAWVKDFESL